jgi:hypothetical protein
MSLNSSFKPFSIFSVEEKGLGLICLCTIFSMVANNISVSHTEQGSSCFLNRPQCCACDFANGCVQVMDTNS